MSFLESKYLNSFFDFLNEKNIKYCVMNNYTEYPDVIPSDIDIMISDATYNQLDELILDYAKQANISVTQKIWHGFKKCAYILSPLLIDSRFRLQLDFFVDFTAKGYYKLLPSDLVLNTSMPYKNFYIPNKCVEVIFLILRRIVKNDSSNMKIEEILKLVNSSNSFWKDANLIFKKDILDFCKNFLNLSVDLHKKNNKEYKKYLVKYSKQNSSLYYQIAYKINEIPRLINRSIFPVGTSVCFLSPDGGGKTTVIHKVTELLDGSFHGVKTFYWRPRWLPPMGQLNMLNPTLEPKSNPSPHSHPLQNPFKSALRFSYYLIDFIFGYYFIVFPCLVRKNLVLFDRYYYDYFIDMRRYQMNLPKWLPKLFSPIVPKPDIIIILSASPEIMMSRKQELSEKELTRQHKEYDQLASELYKCYKIDSSRPLDDVCKDIVSIILRQKATLIEQKMQES